MSSVRIGRKPITQTQRKFKELLKVFEKRFKVEAELLIRIVATEDHLIPAAEQAFWKTVRQLECSNSNLHQRFNAIYDEIVKQEQHSLCQPICSTNMQKYRSKIDPQYWLSQLVKLQSAHHYVNSKDLLLLILFYLFKQKIVTYKFLDWFQANFTPMLCMLRGGDSVQFSQVELNDIAQLVVHLGSLITTSQSISVVFDI